VEMFSRYKDSTSLCAHVRRAARDHQQPPARTDVYHFLFRSALSTCFLLNLLYSACNMRDATSAALTPGVKYRRAAGDKNGLVSQLQSRRDEL
jgi:hypothetical protein